MSLDPHLVLSGVVRILLLLLAVSAHEAAHAWSALRRGDPTAAAAGRVSLNPLRHLDPLGSLLLPLLLIVSGGPVFGWARPTPIRIGRLHDPGRDHLLVTLAGPAMNLLLAGCGLAALAVVLVFGAQGTGEAAQLSLIGSLDEAASRPAFPVVYTLVQLCFLNGLLAVFNLLPVPPLDGGQIVLQLLPPDWARRYSSVRPYGFMIVLGLTVLNVMAVLALPAYVAIALIISVFS